ncbi:hypothetical protein [Arsukibacterium ikkense]|uniref:hypothetical protein n=1 Tax=Arsukibacterium ikkense TaxID=336831 RepID=UPI00128D043F|nr:hypothetical protein [Arsukibacterium ikkense]
MVHCQTMPHHLDTTTSSDLHATVDPAIHTGHHQHAAASTSDTETIAESDVSHTMVEPCEACDHCCSIHCASPSALFTAAASEYHDKVLQRTYFHTSSVVVPQERPPKSV